MPPTHSLGYIHREQDKLSVNKSENISKHLVVIAF